MHFNKRRIYWKIKYICIIVLFKSYLIKAKNFWTALVYTHLIQLLYIQYKKYVHYLLINYTYRVNCVLLIGLGIVDILISICCKCKLKLKEKLIQMSILYYFYKYVTVTTLKIKIFWTNFWTKKDFWWG